MVEIRIYKDFGPHSQNLLSMVFVTVILESITNLELYPVICMTQRNKDPSDLDVDCGLTQFSFQPCMITIH